MSASLVRAGAALVALAAMVSHGDAQSARPANAQTRPSKQYTIEQFMNVTGVRGAGFSADESRVLFSSNKTGIWNVYSIPASGGEWVPITTSTVDSTYAISYFPADDRVLFTRDQGGNELNHLYVKMVDGQEKDLTPGEKLKAQFAGWSGDRTSFSVATNERDARFFDLYRYDAKTLERTLVFKNDLGYMPSGISRDGKWIALVKANTTNDTDVYLWSAASGEAKHITPHTGEATYSPATFDPASAYFYYLSNDGSEFTRVRRYSLAAGTHEDVEKADWDIVSFGFSERGTYRITGVNADGRYALRLVQASSGKPLALPTLPDGSLTGVSFSRSEKRLAFTLNGDRSPSDLYTLTIGQGSPGTSHDVAPAGRGRRRPRRHAGRALQVVRRDGHPEHPVQAAPGHREREGAGARLGPWRPGRADHEQLQRHRAVPREPWLCGARHQQPGQLGLWQILPRGGRPEARA